MPSTKNRLGVPGDINWAACNFTVYSPFETADFEESYRFEIPVLLAANVDVVFYNGDEDLICNFYGTSSLLESMVWPGQNSFANAPNVTWSVGGSPAGTARSAEGLTYVVVGEAGHMVPHDQPENALTLLNNLLTGTPFV